MEGKWIGIVEGTNKGDIALTLSEKDGKLSGFVFVNDIKFQSVAAKIDAAISRDGKTLTGRATEFQPVSESNPKTGTLEAEILEDGLELKGKWKTDIGTEGNFLAFKRIGEQNSQQTAPTAFISKPVNLPPCRLGVNKLAGLLGLMMKDIAFGVE